MSNQKAHQLTTYQRELWYAGSQAPDSPQFNCVLHERLHGKVSAIAGELYARRVGAVVVHFPRFGYIVERTGAAVDSLPAR